MWLVRVVAFLACTYVFAVTIHFVPMWLWVKVANRRALRRAVDRFGRERAKALLARRQDGEDSPELRAEIDEVGREVQRFMRKWAERVTLDRPWQRVLRWICWPAGAALAWAVVFHWGA